MTRFSAQRRIRASAAALVACVAGVIALSTLPQTAAAAGPTVTATPNTGLADGQFVKLQFSGFAPSSAILYALCIAHPVNVATDCTALNKVFFAVADSTGSGTNYFPVFSRAANLPGYRSGYSRFPFVCDANDPCVIAATASGNLATAVDVPISFGPSTDHCPNPGASAVFGSGSSVAYRAIYNWQSSVCAPPNNLPIVYAQSNDVDGANNFAAGQQLANFGVAGPLPSSAFSLPAGAPTYKVAPITGSSVVIAYEMYDRRGPQITDLTLTPYEIAQVFAGQYNGVPQAISLATDPGVAALNPGVQLPSFVQPFSRAEHSSETYVFTSWLSATLGPGSWPMGAVTTWKPQFGVVEASGSIGLGEAVAGINPAVTFSSEGTIGFMDASTAAYYGLPTVKIRMPSGAIADASQTSTVMKGLSLATQNADGTYTPDYTPSSPDVYPMSIPSYMLTPTDQIASEAGKTLAAFLKYAVQQGQTNLPGGYVPLPANMVTQSLDAANHIPQTDAASASSSDSGALGASGLGFNDTLGGMPGSSVPLGSLGGDARPTAQQSSGNRCSSGAAACASSASGSGGGQVASALLVAGSGALAVVIAVAALAAFGVITGPVTYVLARYPRLRQRLRPPWRAVRRPAP